MKMEHFQVGNSSAYIRNSSLQNSVLGVDKQRCIIQKNAQPTFKDMFLIEHFPYLNKKGHGISSSLFIETSLLSMTVILQRCSQRIYSTYQIETAMFRI